MIQRKYIPIACIDVVVKQFQAQLAIVMDEIAAMRHMPVM